MQTNVTIDELTDYTTTQINTFFPDKSPVVSASLYKYVSSALERLEYCFKHIAHPAYYYNQQAKFHLLHADQYCTFLYFLGNTIYRDDGDLSVASKLFYLNKALHSFNCMFDTELPNIFWLIHIVGTVLGKAQYSNFLVVRQNCTIGALSNQYPILGEKLILSAGASIIGACHIGNNVMVGPACSIFKQDIPDNSLVAGDVNYVIRANSDRAFSAHFVNP